MRVQRRRRPYRLVATAVALALGAATLSVAPAIEAEADIVYCNSMPRPVQNTVERIAGADRYATAVAVSKAGFAPRACNIYIASGTGYADALAGAARASRMEESPVLLVKPNSIPAAVVAEIKRLRPSAIHVLGGSGAVSEAVVQQLSTLAENHILRYVGSDRYATAAEIDHGSAPVDTVYIASGQRFPDALAGAPLAGRSRSPLLLVPSTNGIPSSVKVRLSALSPKRIVILGGPGAVSNAVASALRAYTSGPVTRLAGADRFSTAVVISKQIAAPGSNTVYITSGRDYPDALAIAPVAALSWAPVLLVERDSIPDVIGDELRRLQPRHIVIVGGTGAVSADVALQLEEYLVAP